MDFKDKLNLLWKFLFLAVFAYGVFSVTCCSSSASSCSTALKAECVIPNCAGKCCNPAPVTTP